MEVLTNRPIPARCSGCDEMVYLRVPEPERNPWGNGSGSGVKVIERRVLRWCDADGRVHGCAA